MSQKLLNRVFSAVATFSLLVNSLSAPLSVYAQNADLTPTPTETPTPTPTPTETVTPTPASPETLSSTPTPTDVQTISSQTPPLTFDLIEASEESASAKKDDPGNTLSVINLEGEKADAGVPNGAWTSGNVFEYKEEDVIKFRVGLEVDPSETGTFDTYFTHEDHASGDGTCTFFNAELVGAELTGDNFSGTAPAGLTVTPSSVTIVGPAGGNEGKITWTITTDGTIPVNTKAGLIFSLRLSNIAGSCDGSSQHVHNENDTGDVQLERNQNVPVPANKVIILGSITPIKSTENGANPLNWTFNLTGNTSVTGIASGQTAGNLALGTNNGNATYTITEIGPSNWVLDSVTGPCTITGDLTATVVLTSTTPDVTCTFVNRQQTGTLQVVKNVINDNGGTLEADDFTFSVDGNPAVAFEADGQNDLTVNTGNYTITEPSVVGYSTAYSNCTNVFVPAAGSVTCTITNDDIQPLLTVTKIVINDNGGDLEVADFPLFVDGGPVTSGQQNGFSVGDYVVSETGEAGYSSVIGGACDSQGNVSLAVGDIKSCTITNNDIAPTLTLVKTVSNDNGGTKVVADFPLFINGDPVTSGVANSLVANVLYTASESTSYGYQPLSWGGNCAADGTITLAPGDNKTCTITNDDIQPKLTVTKFVINDNGGNALIENFALYVGSTQVLSGAENGFNVGSYMVREINLGGYAASDWGGNCAADGSITLQVGDVKACEITNNDQSASITLIKNVISDNGGNAGENDFGLTIGGTPVNSGQALSVNSNTPYALNETELTGYSFVSITGAGCPRSLGGTVTLNEGENITCTITNDDDAPTITLVKYVNNDDGGNAGENDFGLTIGGNPTTSGTSVEVLANTPYALNEAGLAGYSFVSISGDSKCPTELGGTVTLEEGEDITCTIANDDAAPTITLIKAISDGNALPGDFTLTIGGDTVTSGVPHNVLANTEVAIDEISIPNYHFVSITGDEECPTALGGNVSALNEGDSVTCTITNEINKGDLGGLKFHDINGDGQRGEGENGLQGWTIELYTDNDSQLGDLIDSTDTDEDGFYSFSGIPGGDYSVCEVLKNGWTQTYPADCHSISIDRDGQTIGSLDFGNFENGSIGDFIWEDTDAGGDQDPGEPGIFGVVANLYLDDGDGVFEPGGDDGAPIATDITDGAGGYLFDNLGPGTYWVDIDNSTVPFGFSNTTPDPVGPVILSSNQDYTSADVGYVPPIKEIVIEKSNDKPSASAGDIVTYTLKVTNKGNVALDVLVTDVLPGGFSYVTGSANIGEPGTPEDGTLTWDIGIMLPDDSVTIIYQAKISSDLTAGTYKNLATCQGVLAREDNLAVIEDFVAAALSAISQEQETVDCNVADSSVSIGQSFSYGGQLTPQVLGAATELPATGSRTSLLLFALIVGGFGVYTKIRAYQLGRRKYAKN